ncbi:TetR/AcrR family transcriptional regulator [Saccharopolyspora soli]|uniref:TetR/AcrR family transcriptional regulator n=1 Tax=Saccharopolyspora soli TaxID=2926618 RepID=UPI0035573BD2
MRSRVHGPRDRVRRQVLDATRELLETGGYSACTVDALVSVSGVSKTTIYRWWDNRAEVVLDMLEDAFGLPDAPDDRGSALNRVEQYLAAEMRFHDGPAGPVLRGLLADAQHRPSLAATIESRFLGPRRAALVDLLRLGIAEGALRSETNLSLTASLLLAPLLQSLLTGEPPHGPDLPSQLVEAVVQGAGARDVPQRGNRGRGRRTTKDGA